MKSQPPNTATLGLNAPLRVSQSWHYLLNFVAERGSFATPPSFQTWAEFSQASVKPILSDKRDDKRPELTAVLDQWLEITP